MDSTLGEEGPIPPPLICEESADSELCASDAAMLCSGAEEEEEDDDDDAQDSDAESCICDAYGSAHRGYDYSCDDDAGGCDEEAAAEDGPPVNWWAWLARNAARGAEEAGRREEEGEVASVKPAAPRMEDRVFWETCLAHGYP